MPYDPTQHHRHSIRLKGYDYSQNGAYFVTICTHDHSCLFGEVVEQEPHTSMMRLNDNGRIVDEEWLQTAILRPYVELDMYVVMPNHFHGIIVILDEPDGARHAWARHALPLRSAERAFGRPPPRSLSSVIGGFKSAVARRVNLLRSTPGAPIWQRNYHEHVIRNLADLQRLREYVDANPARWLDDRYHPNHPIIA
jgi:REP element-mobilizing transposase RayT